LSIAHPSPRPERKAISDVFNAIDIDRGGTIDRTECAPFLGPVLPFCYYVKSLLGNRFP
jgi:hypothetical protein